jgi:hypothetical protein
MEARTVIPVCEKHGRFQTAHGRWLESRNNLEKHINFTNSQDAIQTEGECDKCENPEQLDMFRPINVNFRKNED